MEQSLRLQSVPRQRDKQSSFSIEAPASRFSCMGQTDSGSKTTEQVVRLEKVDVDDPRRIFALKEMVLGELGLNIEDMTAEMREWLVTIAGVLQKLGLTTGSRAVVLDRVCELRKRSCIIEDRQRNLDSILASRQKQIAITRERCSILTGFYQHLANKEEVCNELMRAQERSKESDRLKAMSYAEEIEQHKKDLRLRGFSRSLEHRALNHRSERLKAKQKENNALVSRFALFKDLPPSLEEAKKLLQQKQQQLAEINQEFDRLLAGV